MRYLSFIAAALILGQLGGCVVHRHASYSSRPYDAYANSKNYSSNYPRDYSGSYTDSQSYDYDASASEVAHIVNIRSVTKTVETSSTGGAVVGAILGGIIGNQLGRGSDHSHYRGRNYRYQHRDHGSDGARAAATVGGAIIGGMIGGEMDRETRQTQVQTEVVFRLNSGETHTVIVNNSPYFRVGDRVRVSFSRGRWVFM